VVFGAGAIGSLFGALLSNKNNVVLVGRSDHVNVICKNGLTVIGKTQLNVKIHAVNSADDIDFSPDLLIITVKSYDTESAIKQAKKIIGDRTLVMSLQNGLDNIEIMRKHVDYNNIIAGITTHGAIFSKPGIIEHTGIGDLVIGGFEEKNSINVKKVIEIFNQSNITANLSNDILKEIWVKAVVNSSINPLTTIFQCRNGYLLENTILEGIVEKICFESVNVAKFHGIDLSSEELFEKTKDVIVKTSENYSSMYQSYKRGKKTEIDSINGRIVDIGKDYDIDTLLNQTLFKLVNFIC